MATTEGWTCWASSATSHQHAVSAAQYSGSLQRAVRRRSMSESPVAGGSHTCGVRHVEHPARSAAAADWSRLAIMQVLTSCACHRRQVPARAARRWAAGSVPPLLQGPPAARLVAVPCPQQQRLGILPLRCLGWLPGQGLLAAAAAAAAAAEALLPMAALHRPPHPGTALHRLLRPVAAGWRSTALV